METRRGREGAGSALTATLPAHADSERSAAARAGLLLFQGGLLRWQSARPILFIERCPRFLAGQYHSEVRSLASTVDQDAEASAMRLDQLTGNGEPHPKVSLLGCEAGVENPHDV